MLNFHAGYRCTLVPRLPFPVPPSPFPVTSFSNIRLKAPAKRSQHCWAQHVACVWPRVAMCCDMLGVVGSNLTIFKLEPTTPNMSQHIATGWPNARNMSRPTMLRYVALTCCDRLARALHKHFMELIFLDENSQYFCILLCNFFVTTYNRSRWENLDRFQYRFQPIKFGNSVVPGSCETEPYNKYWLLTKSEVKMTESLRRHIRRRSPWTRKGRF